jgi:hypothetical protein
MAEFLPHAVDHWDAARALEWINATFVFATQPHRDAAKTLCSDGPAMFASFSAKSVRPDMSRDEFLALLSADVITMVHRQAHQKPPDTLLSVLELLEDKNLVKAIQTKPFKCLLNRELGMSTFLCFGFFLLQK